MGLHDRNERGCYRCSIRGIRVLLKDKTGMRVMPGATFVETRHCIVRYLILNNCKNVSYRDFIALWHGQYVIREVKSDNNIAIKEKSWIISLKIRRLSRSMGYFSFLCSQIMNGSDLLAFPHGEIEHTLKMRLT